MKIAENIVNVLERTLESMHAVNTIQVHMEIDKPARLIIRLLFGFASDLVFDKFNQSTNTETAMLSIWVSLLRLL